MNYRHSLALLSLLSSANSLADSVTFDPNVLRARGLDLQLAEYFQDAPRFQQGTHSLLLSVNGVPKGRVLATFDEQGELCTTETLLEQANMRVEALPNLDCRRFVDSFDGVIARLDPGKEQIELLLPTGLVAPTAAARRNYAHGGSAALFNYDALVLGNEYVGQTTHYRSLNTELGLNINDWALRSRQSYAAFDGSSQTEHLYAYASRTFESLQTNLQLGQLNMASPLFAGEAFTGVQLQPEAALGELEADSEGAHVEGIAYSAARVEVRQNGALIYTTLVPPGPFSLVGLPLLSQSLDLEVTVYEEDGQQRSFIVPGDSLGGLAPGRQPGFAVTAGRVRRYARDDRDAPDFVAASKDWRLAAGKQLTAGAMLGSDYQSAGMALQIPLLPRTALGLRQVVSRARREDQLGAQFQFSLSTALTERVSANLSVTQQVQGFRTLSDTTWNRDTDQPDQRIRNQMTLGLSGASLLLGSFSGGFSRFTDFEDDTSSRLSASWSRMFQRTSVSLSLERDMGGSAHDSRGFATYLTVSVPMGRSGALRSFVRKDDLSGTRSGLRLNQQINDAVAYSATVERPENGEADVSGRLNLLPRYTQVDLGYSQRGSGSTGYDFGARGGVALHSEGLTLSPYTVRETFALLKAGDAAGVKLRTPYGPVWTDAAGRAVVASVPAYRNTRVEIDTASLARNVDVLNGYREIAAARGSVQRLEFQMATSRRVLLHAHTADDQVVGKGFGVFDELGRYVTSVLDDGRIFLSDIQADAALHVQKADGSRCHLTFELAEEADPDELYESASARCSEA